MKNKKLVYLLVPLVFAIWGIIGYKIWSSLSDDEDVSPLSKPLTASLPIAELTSDQLPTLKLDYPDPFLDRQIAIAQKTSGSERPTLSAEVRPTQSGANFRSVKSLPAAPPAPAQIVIWPALEYRGLIENRQKGTKVAMLTINGTDYLLQEGQRQQDITLSRIYPDSVLLSLQKQQRILKRMR